MEGMEPSGTIFRRSRSADEMSSLSKAASARQAANMNKKARITQDQGDIFNYRSRTKRISNVQKLLTPI